MIKVRFTSDKTIKEAAGLVPGQSLFVELPDGSTFFIRRLGPDYQVQWSDPAGV